MNIERQKFVRKTVRNLDDDIAREILCELFIAAIDREMNVEGSIIAMDDVLTTVFDVKDFR